MMSEQGAARDRFTRADSLFQAVCELPAPEQRARLIGLAPDNPALVEEVMGLLHADAEADARVACQCPEPSQTSRARSRMRERSQR